MAKASRSLRHNDSPFDHVERAVRLILALFVVGLMFWVILANPLLTTDAQINLKILVAFAMAVLMASMAGVIEVKGKSPGWAIRAAGGGAVFVIVFFTLPKIAGSLDRIPKAKVYADDLTSFDLRSMGSPLDKHKQLSSGVAITVPLNLSANSDFNNANPAQLTGARMQLRVAERKLSLPWLYFVKQVPGPGVSHLSAEPLVPASSVEIEKGKSTYREVLFATSPTQINWEQLVKHLTQVGGMELEIKWNIEHESGSDVIEQVCRTPVDAERDELQIFSAQSRIPKNIVFHCLE